MNIWTRMLVAILVGAVIGVSCALLGNALGVNGSLMGGVAGALSGAFVATVLRPKKV
jgi:gas vesicle protein